MPKRDISFKLLAGYAQSPIDVAVPGIGASVGDSTKDSILDYLVTLDLTFGMSISDRVAIGFDVGAYRTATGLGYGERGRYGVGGTITEPSTGLQALRPLSNIDPAASPDDPSAYLGDGLSGPLDGRSYAEVMAPMQAGSDRWPADPAGKRWAAQRPRSHHHEREQQAEHLEPPGPVLCRRHE